MKLSESHEGIGGGGVIAPFILNLGTRWQWVVSFTSRPLPFHYPLNRELDGFQSWSKGHIFECSIDCDLSQYVACEVLLSFLHLMNLTWLELNLKAVALNGKQAQTRVKGISLAILDPLARGEWVVSATPRPLSPWERHPLPFVQEAVYASGMI
jgi:hypothetical protein